MVEQRISVTRSQCGRAGRGTVAGPAHHARASGHLGGVGDGGSLPVFGFEAAGKHEVLKYIIQAPRGSDPAPRSSQNRIF